MINIGSYKSLNVHQPSSYGDMGTTVFLFFFYVQFLKLSYLDEEMVCLHVSHCQ